jgi:rRNA-processing protein FCF1
MLFGFTYNRNVFESAIRQFPGYKLLVSRGIIRELTKISANKGNRGLRARVALLELKAKKINVDNISIYPDKWILDTSLKNKESIVITNDSALARKLKLGKIRTYKISRSGILKAFNDYE